MEKDWGEMRNLSVLVLKSFIYYVPRGIEGYQNYAALDTAEG